MSDDPLYNLLPTIYRVRDVEQGEPLRALLALISEEMNGVEADITSLYENWFIETADEWVVPYIGDLLGVRGLTTITSTAFSQRRYVANTLFYRRRKGTAYVLEQLARDVTGWPAHVVEFFEVLDWTQNVNHIRLFNTTPDLRSTNSLNLIDKPFDSLPHTVDVRHINNRRGKHNIPNIGLFLWRLQNYPLQKATARQSEVADCGWHFSPLGNPAPLFNLPLGEGAVDEQTVPAPIRQVDFLFDLKTYAEKFASDPNAPVNSRYFGPARSVYIEKDNVPVKTKDVVYLDLKNWSKPPSGKKVAVDVELGRMTFATGQEPASGVAVWYNYGFSADIGGGPYERRERLTEITASILEIPVGPGKPDTTLAAALSRWQTAGKPDAVIRIYDSATYDANLAIDLPSKGWLVIDADNGQRPVLIGADPLKVNAPTGGGVTAEDAAGLTLSGLVVEGYLDLTGKLTLTITDSTLVPGRALDEDGFPQEADEASLVVSGTDVTDLNVIISRSLIGAIEMPAECQSLVISDSVVDAPAESGSQNSVRAAIAADKNAASPGPITTLERVTVFGEVYVKILKLASEVVFSSPVLAERRQEGCVRFSVVAAPDESFTPRRYQCQPDLAIAGKEKELDRNLLPDEYDQLVMRLRPQFTSRQYGQPAYAQLSIACAEEIKTGAEDGSEMGVFCMLQQPQREANLRTALDEYLRFGLEAGIFLVT
jgi:hypothetical protein